MLASSSLLLDYLRRISLDTIDLRLERAVLAAQLLAYKAPIHSQATLDEVYNKTIDRVKKILGEVNEEYTLDIGLALRLYSGVLATRIRLISNATQFDVIKTVLESESAESEVGAAASELLVQLASNKGQMLLTAQAAGQLDALTED